MTMHDGQWIVDDFYIRLFHGHFQIECGQIKNNLSSGMPKVRGDRDRLAQIFINLIDNAIKFNKPEGSVEISAAVQDKTLVVSVKDSGVGISSENIPKIFNQFFHFEGTGPQSPSPGNGLGLSIALSIAKVHQGLIDVHSQVGKGSTFVVRLPII